MIAIDEIFLKAKYLGTTFIAACKDDNNQICLLAFGLMIQEMMFHGSDF